MARKPNNASRRIGQDRPVQSSQFRSTSPAAPQLAPDEETAPGKGAEQSSCYAPSRRLSIFNASFPVLACLSALLLSH